METTNNIEATIIALEKQALEQWNNGNPDDFLDLSSDDVVYIDPTVQVSSDVAVMAYNYEAHRDGMTFRMNCTEVYRLEPSDQWKTIHTHGSFVQTK